jgi:PPOX class probable F420-dependent enzyme
MNAFLLGSDSRGTPISNSPHYTLGEHDHRAAPRKEACMSEPNTAPSAAVKRRLQQEEIIWFTTVSPRGVPTPNPVWFHWDGEYIVVYSQPESFRVRNIKANPQVALTLQGVDGLGNNVVIINGEAELRPGNRVIPDVYWKKYARLLQQMSPDEMTASYNVEIRVKPIRIRVE